MFIPPHLNSATNVYSHHRSTNMLLTYTNILRNVGQFWWVGPQFTILHAVLRGTTRSRAPVKPTRPFLTRPDLA